VAVLAMTVLDKMAAQVEAAQVPVPLVLLQLQTLVAVAAAAVLLTQTNLVALVVQVTH
jgi:hypothetical protein